MTKRTLGDFGTPFNALKTAEQAVQFANDPTRKLTRQRYLWFSNGTRFDATNLSTPSGEIELSTSSTGTDTARLHSAVSGQYVSQALAQPGIRVSVPSADTSIDNSGLVSLSQGRVLFGAFWHNGTQVTTGIGIELNKDGAEIFWKSEGSHKGNSPVSQGDWSHDNLTGNGESGIQLDPADGYIYNFPYTWYNAGKLGVELIDSSEDKPVALHSFDPPEDAPGAPSLETANLPVQLVVENDGDTSSTTAALGGMQYTLYGADGVRETRQTVGITGERSVTTNQPASPNPITTPGDPIYAVRRESGNDDLEVNLTRLFIDASDDVQIHIWDVWDDSSAFTGTSWESTFRNNDAETNTEFDRSATDFTVTSNALLRASYPVGTGQKNEEVLGRVDVDDRLPIDATRVITATDINSTDPTVVITGVTQEGF